MKYFAIAVFGLHVFIETVFGVRGFLAGAFSWQAGADLGDLEAQISGSARFLTSGLLALAALGAWGLFVAGVASSAGRAVAAVLALFHLLGVIGVALTAMEHAGFAGTTNAQGAVLIHGVLGIGFLLVAVLHGRMRAVG